MARILIWMSPEAGHILPTVKCARDLQSRGHEVIYLSCGKIRSELSMCGFGSLPFFEEHEGLLQSRSMLTPCPPAKVMYDELRRQYPDRACFLDAIRQEILKAVREAGTACVLIDGVMAEFLHLEIECLLSSDCRVARVHTHLPYLQPVLRGGSRGRETIYLSPRVFEVPKYIDPAGRYTEASNYPGPYAEMKSFNLNSGLEKLVYCSLGTQVELIPNAEQIFEAVLEAAKRMPQSCFVISCCSQKLAARLTANHASELALMDHVSIVDFAPQMQILKCASAMITHAGFGAIKDGIYHGVPLLALPQLWDQTANGERVALHGIGLSITDAQTPDRIGHALKRLLTDEAIKSKMLRMRDEFRKIELEQRTADLCEELLLD